MKLKNLSALPSNGQEAASHQPPPLENESLHRRLARLDNELKQATEALQQFNREWAQKNIEAQSCRQAISTPEITHATNKRRELAARIQDLQSQLGAANKERRALTNNAPNPSPKKLTRSKSCPLRQHHEWLIYFELAARDELLPELYDKIERAAKSAPPTRCFYRDRRAITTPRQKKAG